MSTCTQTPRSWEDFHCNSWQPVRQPVLQPWLPLLWPLPLKSQPLPQSLLHRRHHQPPSLAQSPLSVHLLQGCSPFQQWYRGCKPRSSSLTELKSQSGTATWPVMTLELDVMKGCILTRCLSGIQQHWGGPCIVEKPVCSYSIEIFMSDC